MMIDPMQDLGRAIDEYDGELARKQLSPTTRTTYKWQLNHFASSLPDYIAVSEIDAGHVRRFLNRWNDSSPSTMGSAISNLRGFFDLMIKWGHVQAPGPMYGIERPRRKRAEDLEVTTISERDANRLIEACETWQELLCITVGLYTGRRRAALNAVLRRDVDLDRNTIRFKDKGAKVIIQPMPAQLAAIIRAADDKGVWGSQGEYLIPSRRPGSLTRKGLRKDSVIWDTVKIVAERAGVEAHVHALRAAFAVKFDQQHPDRLDTLRELMGHAYIDTTRIYLRRKDRARDMEAVIDLSWGSAPFVPEDVGSGSNREGIDPEKTPAFAGVSEVRPIRDSNPCSDDSQEQSGDGEGDPPLRRAGSALDAKLDELEARRSRKGRRVR